LVRKKDIMKAKLVNMQEQIFQTPHDARLDVADVFRPMDYFSPPYPDESMIRAAQALDTLNSQEVGQMTFAVQNKKGSRTTAREIVSAEQQNSLLNSVQLILFSTHLREVFSFDWLIVQSRALQGLFPFMAHIENQIVDPATQQVTVVYENDMEQISKTYEVRAAGDIDVVLRAEKLAQFKEAWPLVANTSVAPAFLQDMLKLMFPDIGDKYAAMLQQTQTDKMLVGRLAQVLAAFVQANPTLVQQLPPQDQQAMQQLMQEVQMSQQQMM